MKKSSSGYILILTLFVSGIIFLLTVYFLDLLKSEKTFTLHGKQDLIAEAAANAGIAEAVSELQANTLWSGTLNNSTAASNASYTMTFTPGTPPYSTNNTAGVIAVTGYGGRQVPPKMVHLVALGLHENSRLIEEALVGDSPFKQGIFAEDSVTLNGAVTLSSMDPSISNAIIGTNAISAGSVTLNGTVDVQGSITVGPGGTASAIDANGGASYQSFQAAPKEQSLPVIQSPPGVSQGDRTFNGGISTLLPGTYGSLTVQNGAQLTLSSGAYVFTDDIKSTGGNIQIAPGGVVTIYAEKDISFTGSNEINATMSDGSQPLASNLLVYGGENTTSVSFGGNYTAYLSLYAPLADITFSGSGDVYGSFVGKTVTTNGVAGGPGGGLAIHYDPSLATGVVIPIVKTRW